MKRIVVSVFAPFEVVLQTFFVIHWSTLLCFYFACCMLWHFLGQKFQLLQDAFLLASFALIFSYYYLSSFLKSLLTGDTLLLYDSNIFSMLLSNTFFNFWEFSHFLIAPLLKTVDSYGIFIFIVPWGRLNTRTLQSLLHNSSFKILQWISHAGVNQIVVMDT